MQRHEHIGQFRQMHLIWVPHRRYQLGDDLHFEPLQVKQRRSLPSLAKIDDPGKTGRYIDQYVLQVQVTMNHRSFGLNNIVEQGGKVIEGVNERYIRIVGSQATDLGGESARIWVKAR